MARIDKINEEVKRELANIIRELKDTRIPLMTGTSFRGLFLVWP